MLKHCNLNHKRFNAYNVLYIPGFYARTHKHDTLSRFILIFPNNLRFILILWNTGIETNTRIHTAKQEDIRKEMLILDLTNSSA